MIEVQSQIKSGAGSLANYPVYEITNVWATSLPDTNAKWIWNDPYASSGEDVGTTSFYTTINNPSYVQIPYTIYYRADEPITLSINEAPIGIASQSGTSSATNPGSNVISILPGQNRIKVSVTNTTYSTAGVIITFKNNNTRLYENSTNPTNWFSTDAPSNSFTQTSATYTIYNIDKPSTWTVSLPGNAKWIWNQPNAGTDAGTETVNFYLSIPIGGTSVKTYTIYFTTSDYCTITVNSLQIGSAYNNGNNSITTYSEATFQVVPGTNLINASIYNYGGTAGFIAVIKDDNGNYIYPTMAGGSWTVTTSTLYNESTNPCAYMAASDTRIGAKCLESIWKQKCSGSYPSNDFSGFTMSGFGTEVDTKWASRTASSANQIACKGKTVCNNGFTYVNYGVFGKCEKTTDSVTDTPNQGLKSCDDWSGRNCICGECSKMNTNSDGSCSWESSCWSKGTCAGTVDCGVWHDRSSLRVELSERDPGCPSGYTPSSFGKDGRICSRTYCTEGTLQGNGKCLTSQDPNF